MKAIVLWERGKDNHESYSKEDTLDGYVLFYQSMKDHPVKVRVYLDGLEKGAHGFHIHEKGYSSDMWDEDCCSAMGGHFNIGEKWSPENIKGTPHGEHTGDLCFNIIPNIDGMVDIGFTNKKISLFEGEGCIIGKGLVIHEDEDDMGVGIYEDEDKTIESKKTGNAGKRIACGNIVLFYG